MTGVQKVFSFLQYIYWFYYRTQGKQLQQTSEFSIYGIHKLLPTSKLSLIYRYISFFIGSNIDLARSRELPVLIIDAFFPLSYPSGEPTDSEHNSKHIGGDPDGAQHDTAVKVNVWIKIILDEIVVF